MLAAKVENIFIRNVTQNYVFSWRWEEGGRKEISLHISPHHRVSYDGLDSDPCVGHFDTASIAERWLNAQAKWAYVAARS